MTNKVELTFTFERTTAGEKTHWRPTAETLAAVNRWVSRQKGEEASAAFLIKLFLIQTVAADDAMVDTYDTEAGY